MAGKSKTAAILMTCFAAFGGILFGYDTGTIGGIIAMNDWLQTFGYATGDPALPYDITTSTQSLVVSVLSAGTFFGALFAYPIGDFVGRKWGLIVSCGIFCVGVAMQTASTAVPLFAVGRVFAGMGVGLVSCLVPMYQSECSPQWLRGAIVSCYQWAITIGLLLAAIVNNATKDRADHSSYRIPIAIQFVWAAILSGGLLFLPESPRWLIKKGHDEKARQSLGRLFSADPHSDEVNAEFANVLANLEAEKEIGQTSYLDCFRPGPGKNLLRTLTGISLQAWQQLTGVNFIFYYGTTFFKSAGITNPFLVSVATNVINVAMTVPAILGADRVGRRRLLLIGAVGMCFCEYIVAIVGVTVSTENLAGQRVLIAFVCIYIAFFASTWGPIAWVVTAEIYPLAIRAKAMSLSTASNWLWNFAIAYATPYLVNDPNPAKGTVGAALHAKVFFIWGSTCFGCVLFTYFFIPETKGLSLEQVDLLYRNSTVINSNKYRQQLLSGNVHASDVQAGGLHKADIPEKTDSDEHHDKVAQV
jgi:SP family sugar:H+ symporter-like MFS transporter